MERLGYRRRQAGDSLFVVALSDPELGSRIVQEKRTRGAAAARKAQGRRSGQGGDDSVPQFFRANGQARLTLDPSAAYSDVLAVTLLTREI